MLPEVKLVVGDLWLVTSNTWDNSGVIIATMCPLFGFEVNKPFDFFIKISNVAEYIESDIQSIEASRIDDPII